MLKRFIYLLSLPLVFVVVSCGGEKNTSSTKHDDEKYSASEGTEISISDTNSIGLFLFYSEKCEEMEFEPAIEFVDAQDIVDEAFSDKYERPQVEDAFEWYISKVIFNSEALITMVVTSFTEGTYHNYLVTLNSNNEVPQFDLLNKEGSFVEVNFADCVTGKN